MSLARNPKMHGVHSINLRRPNDGLQILVPILLERMAEQGINAWDTSQTRKDFEELVTRSKDEVVPLALNFILKNVKHPELKFRVAAARISSCIIKRPRSVPLTRAFVEVILPALIEPLRNATDPDRDETLKELMKLSYEFWSQVAAHPSINPTKLLTTLVTILEGQTFTAHWASLVLVQLPSPARVLDESTKYSTYLVSPFFEELVQQLLTVQDRVDGEHYWANYAPYVMWSILDLAPISSDLYDVMLRTTIVILNHGEASLSIRKTSTTARARFHREPGNPLNLVCIALDGILPRISKTDVHQIEDRVVNILIHVLRRPGGRVGTTHRSALTTLATFVRILGEGFMKHMDSLWPFVACRLPTTIDTDIQTVNLRKALQVTKSIGFALGHRGFQYYDEIMDAIFDSLRKATFKLVPKPRLSFVLRDMAQMLGPHFQKYSDKLKQILMEAFKVRRDMDYNESVDHLNRLRFGLCVAYASIIQGLKTHDVPNSEETGGPATTGLSILQPHLRHLINLLKKISIREYMPDQLAPVVIQVIYWIVHAYGTRVFALLDDELIYELLDKRTRYVDILDQSFAEKAKNMLQENVQRFQQQVI